MIERNLIGAGSSQLSARRGEVHRREGGNSRPARINLYDEVADRIIGLIERGTFRAGDRVPSIRQLHQQFRVSLSTVMEAYRVLEDRGILEARPQSGYYVRSADATATPVQQWITPAFEAQCAPLPVSMPDLVMRVMLDTRNPDLVQLGTATPNSDLAPTEKLIRIQASILRREGANIHAYDLPPGCEALRTQIARRVLRSGCALGPDQLVTTNGAQEALHLALRAVCKPGDTVALESPTFYGTLQLIESLGLKALEIPSCARDGISIDALEYALSQTDIAACLLIPNFSNPLGGLMPTQNKRDLVRLLAERDIPLIEDDIYGELHHAVERPDVAKCHDTNGSVILCSSFSKTISPGYRVGWIAAGRYQKRVEYLKMIGTLGCPMPTQLTFAEFLACGGYDHHLRGIRRVYARQTAIIRQAIADAFPAGTKISRPQGGFVLWVECPPTVDSIALYYQAVERGIAFAPGPIFSASGRYANCLRMNTVYWSPEVERAIDTLGKLVAKMC